MLVRFYELMSVLSVGFAIGALYHRCRGTEGHWMRLTLIFGVCAVGYAVAAHIRKGRV
jgi:hypothetical protein